MSTRGARGLATLFTVQPRSGAAARNRSAGTRPGSASRIRPRLVHKPRQQVEQQLDVARARRARRTASTSGHGRALQRARPARAQRAPERLELHAVALRVRGRGAHRVGRPVGGQHAPAGQRRGDARQAEPAAQLERRAPRAASAATRRGPAPRRSSTARPSRAGTPRARTPPRRAAPRRRAGAQQLDLAARQRDPLRRRVVTPSAGLARRPPRRPRAGARSGRARSSRSRGRRGPRPRSRPSSSGGREPPARSRSR